MSKIDFIEFMEGSPITFEPEHPKMDMYWQSDQWILEPVVRGRRYQCLINDGSVSFSSRHGEAAINDKIPHIVNEIIKIIPDGSLVDGIISAGDDTLKILESSVEKSLNLQIDKPLQFIIYDVLYWDCKICLDFPLFDRKKKFEFIGNSGNVKVSKSFIKDKYKIYQSLKNDYDAFYFRDLDFENVGRTSSRWKIYKELQSFFAIIIDVLEGKGKFENMCGALEVGQFKKGKMTHITNVSGMTNDDRIRFFEDKKQFIGKIIEIKALRKTKSNFIEARFSKLRDDKVPQDCVFEEG